MAVQDYELLLRVRADLIEAISGLKGLTTELGQGDSAAAKLGESADEASARIKAMVQASLDQQKAMQGSNAATRQASEQAAAIVRDYDEQAAAAKRAATEQVNYNKSFSQGGGNTVNTASVTAAIAAQRTEMAKLAGQIDPTIAALAKLDAQERSLNALHKAGVVGTADYAAFKGVIDQNRVALSGAAGAAEKFAFNSAAAKREYGVLIGELARGNTARLEGSLVTLANRTGFLTALFSPLGLAIMAVVGTVGAFALAANSAANDENKFNESIAQTGNYAGVTTSQLGKMASGITYANGKISDSRTVLTALVSSGKVGTQSLQSLGQAAVDMAALTGMSADKAAQSVLQMFDGTAKGAAKADEQYHFLTTSIYDQIKALEDEGNTQQAMDVAAEAFHAAAQQRIEDMSNRLYGLAALWNTVKVAADGAWERMKVGASVLLGTADDQTRIYELLGKQANAKEGGLNLFGNVAMAALPTGLKQYAGYVPGATQKFSDSDQAELAMLQKRVADTTTDAENAGTQKRLTGDAVQADVGLDRLSASVDKAYAKKEKIKELNKYFTDLWAGADPDNAKLQGVQRVVNADGSASFSGGLYDTLMADIEKDKSPKAKRNPQDAIDKAAATAQQQLIEALGDMQGKLDPTAAAWATYNKEVDKANKLADTAAKGTGANITAINAQRDAYVEAAARVRDASIAKEADKDRLAFEKLRDSLKNTDGISLDKVSSQLRTLKGYLDKGTINQDEYNSTVPGVVQNGLKKLPSYRGVDGSIGGAKGELDKTNIAQENLEKMYKADLDALNTWHDQKLISDQQFIAAENQLYTEHADELAKIQQAQLDVSMSAVTSSTAAMASALKTAFGEQSAAYHAAFALSKAAAIAQASVNLYQAISNAMKDLPYPANIIAMAQVASQGATLISAISSISAGFSAGGYTGPGGINQPAGVVHKGEVVWSQADIARAGGVSAVETMRLGVRGMPDPANMPSWLQPPLEDPIQNPTSLPSNGADNAATNRGNSSAAGQTHIHVWSVEEAAQKLAESPTMQKAVVHIVGDNPRTIQGKWKR